jgi:hypothetical protein
MAKRPWLLPSAILVLAFGCVQIIGVEPGTSIGTDGGGGSTSSSSGTTGHTCTASTCTVAASCPVPPLCFTAGCKSDCCTVHYTPAGTSCDGFSSGTCDGAGDCVCTFETDCPVLECQTAGCSTGGTTGYCYYAPASQGTPCFSGVGLCDGDGGCSM